MSFWKKLSIFLFFYFLLKHRHSFYLWMICHFSNFTKLKRNTLVQKVKTFFFPQLYNISQTDPQEDLAKFGYTKNVKIKHF
jgi:hypothetical protein